MQKCSHPNCNGLVLLLRYLFLGGGRVEQLNLMLIVDHYIDTFTLPFVWQCLSFNYTAWSRPAEGQVKVCIQLEKGRGGGVGVVRVKALIMKASSYVMLE